LGHALDRQPTPPRATADPCAPTPGATASGCSRRRARRSPSTATRLRSTTSRGAPRSGSGTVYRHFPTKEALAEALLVDSFERITAHARQSLEVADPWEALTAVLWFGAELLAANRGLTESLAAHPRDWKSSTETELRAAMAELIRRGEEAGVLRPGVVDDDIPMLMCGIGFAYRRPHVHPESWRRHLTVIIDGLRAGSASGQLPD
jgi:AcrR family transcriptional regulator